MVAGVIILIDIALIAFFMGQNIATLWPDIENRYWWWQHKRHPGTQADLDAVMSREQQERLADGLRMIVRQSCISIEDVG